MQKFKMHVEVPAKLVGTIIELLADEGVVISVEQMKSGAPAPRYAGGKRNKGISSRDLVIQTVGPRGATIEQIRTAFAGRGFAPTSVHPALNGLVKTKILIEKNGIYSKR